MQQKPRTSSSAWGASGLGLGIRLGLGGRCVVGPAHDELPVHGVEGDRGVVVDVAGQQRPPDSGLDPVGDEAAQGPGAVDGVVALAGDQLAGGGGYLDRGNLATIGRGAAVADIKGLKLSGFIAWVTWLVVHLWYLVGFRNRALVFMDWAFSFFSRGRGTRLITAPPTVGAGGPGVAPGETVR